MDNNYINDESFSFDNFDNENNLNFDNISGLGESNYENEDLFGTEAIALKKIEEDHNEILEPQAPNLNNQDILSVMQKEVSDDNKEEFVQEEKEEETPKVEENNLEVESNVEEEVKSSSDETIENATETPKINILTDTPIEELQKLTEYTEEKINSTDIKSLFDRVGVNVKEASDIFKKNTEMKEKIDSRFEELKKLQSEIEKAKRGQYDEINAYKEEVLSKLTEKKDEIEKRLNKLKGFQSTLEEEKAEFEKYKKQEKEEIARVQKEIQEAYDSRREELSHIEDVLRRQKDSLDEERNKLSLDIIQYESDKNELANNLLKFNEIVASFTNGMEKINKE